MSISQRQSVNDLAYCKLEDLQRQAGAGERFAVIRLPILPSADDRQLTPDCIRAIPGLVGSPARATGFSVPIGEEHSFGKSSCAASMRHDR